jgi:S-DNA-T family DNA segregation ATPase FtsK/SpoIIIE
MRSILATIVYSMNNCACELVLSDTKGVEFTDFVGCKHLRYGEAATTPLRTVEQMDLLCKETDRRLTEIGNKGYRNIQDYNAGYAMTQTYQFATNPYLLPYIILAIDELADIVDLPSEKGKARRIGAEKLDYLTRKARAAGIHVIASTQRPSVDVVKGVIKSNFMARICFRVPSSVDSRVVLDEVGAEHLLKQGDMLYKSPNFPGLQRLHSGLATSADIAGALRYASYQQGTNQKATDYQASEQQHSQEGWQSQRRLQ